MATVLTVAGVLSAATSSQLQLLSFNCGTWEGTATRIDPATAEPLFPEVPYVLHQRPTASGEACACQVDVDLGVGKPSASSTVVFGPSCTDVDIDGSYSTQRSVDETTRALAGSSRVAAEGEVLDMCVALSDNERYRCLLAYEANCLAHVVLLRERRVAEDGTATPGPPPSAPCTLTTLLGDWHGDATLRRPPPTARPAGGFGQRRKAAPGVVNVYKATVRFQWDGRDLVVRRLQCLHRRRGGGPDHNARAPPRTRWALWELRPRGHEPQRK